jgi:hypothetical protein
MLRARSTFSSLNDVNGARPVTSVSSVSGVGANAPVPTESRAVHPPGALTSADRRGLKKVPYSLWASTRPLAENASHGAGSTSYCANTAGIV